MTDKSAAVTMKITLVGGGKIPAKVLGLTEDKQVKPGEAVEVPASYGKFWVGRGVAKEVSAEAKAEDAAATEDETAKATKASKAKAS